MTDENQKPDYSFIMNQPGPDPETSARKGRGGLFFAIIAGVGVLIVLAVALTFMNMKAVNVKPVNDNITQYLQYLEQDNTEKAAELVNTNPKVDPVVFKVLARTFRETYKLKECAISNTTYKNPTFSSTVSCPYAKKTGNATLTIESAMVSNQPKITKVSQ